VRFSALFPFTNNCRLLNLLSTVILDCALVKIGDRVLFGTGVSLITATHETSIQSRRDGVEYALPITIGDDCWLGSNVTVLPGVTIGNGCTIAAGSIVSKDVPEYSVAMVSHNNSSSILGFMLRYLGLFSIPSDKQFEHSNNIGIQDSP